MLEFSESPTTKLLHEEITKEIIGASFEVHRELGYGFLEDAPVAIECLRPLKKTMGATRAYP